MNFRIISALVSLAALVSCVETDYRVGGNLVPDSYKYKIVAGVKIPLDVKSQAPDSLSGYSSTRFVVGSIKSPDFGVVERSSTLTLVPLDDTLDFGTNPKFKSFHFNATVDTISAYDDASSHMLQTLGVYELAQAVDANYINSGNTPVEFVDGEPTPEQKASNKVLVKKGRVTNTFPVTNGYDSISFDFTRSFAEKYLTITQDDLSDMDKYKKKFPGIYIDTKAQAVDGGRINFFNLQLGFDSDSYLVTGSFAELSFSSTYSGVEKDTSFLFYFSPTDFYDIDSLLTNSATGSFPQYCLNLTKQDTSRQAVLAADRTKVYIEGGGAGLKPYIDSKKLRQQVFDAISSRGDDPTGGVIITKATLVLPFIPQDTETFSDLERFPAVMSPTVRLHAKYTAGDTTLYRIEYAGIADASASTENQGDVNRSLLRYQPDITYHLQSIVSLDTTKTSARTAFQKGEYDIWLLTMAYETVVTVTAADQDLSDYYSMLAYQSYYNSMYGGSSSGYGDYYSNYYSYMMAAMYASSSSSSTSTSLQLDRDRYYKGVLEGPEATDPDSRPYLLFSYAIPKN